MKQKLSQFNKFLVRLHVNAIYLFSFVETLRKFIIAELSIRKLGSSSVLIIRLLKRDVWIQKVVLCIFDGLPVKLSEVDTNPQPLVLFANEYDRG